MAMPSVDHDELGLRACDGVKPNMHRGSEVSFAFRLQPAYTWAEDTRPADRDVRKNRVKCADCPKGGSAATNNEHR